MWRGPPVLKKIIVGPTLYLLCQEPVTVAILKIRVMIACMGLHKKVIIMLQ